MIGAIKPSDLNQETKTIWNPFVLFESEKLRFESGKIMIQIRFLEEN